MRLGVVWEAGCASAFYRAIDPMKAMEERGHQVSWPEDISGQAEPARLAGCDVVHVYRRAAHDTQRVLMELVGNGTAITYDNDDDFTAVPKQSPHYKETGGLKGQRIFAMTVKVARMARRLTTPSEVLAEKYRRAGVKHVDVIPNVLAPSLARRRRRHDGTVIGWVAGLEHMVDAHQLNIADALRRVIAKHDNVWVECIGVNLGLPERYRHDRVVRFVDLPSRIGGFDIGIAPLANILWNRSRSDIKVKEYAGCGVPWLASPVGPYASLGPAEGGRLVPDDGWFDALDQLVENKRERRALAQRAAAWAKQQTLKETVDQWEQVFADAAGRGISGRGSMSLTSGFRHAGKVRLTRARQM
jgi:glycosyltransferase involved in cell wall biosynthesis